MKLIKPLLVFIFLMLCVAPCWAKYKKYYDVADNTYVTTKSTSNLYELPDYYKSDILNGKFASTKRDFIDVENLKVKKLKKQVSLKVLKLTNTQKIDSFNAYIVDYKEKLWVLIDTDVQDNSLLNARNDEMLNDMNDLVVAKNVLEHRRDSLKMQYDNSVASYEAICTDSINYYKELKSNLPLMVESLLTITRQLEEEKAKKAYDEWYNKQPASTQRASKIISVINSSLDSPNSAGGCDYHFYYTNRAKKTIKYLYVNGTVYNAVNDPVYCEIHRTSSFSGKDTGPVDPGKSGGGCWENIIYNYSANSLKVTSVKIVYMDGSSVTISGADIHRLINEPSTSVFVSSYDIKKQIMSEADCDRLIDKWKARRASIKSSVSYSSRDDGKDEMWVKINNQQAAIKSIEADVWLAKGYVKDLNSFIKFEDYSSSSSVSSVARTNDKGNGTSYYSSQTSSKNEIPFVSIGIEGSVEGLKSWSTGWGLSMRLGKYSSLFNATVGIKYQYTGYKDLVSYSYEDYRDGRYYDYVYSYADYKRKVNQLVFPVIANCNLVHSEYFSLYLGAGYEFGVSLSDQYSFEYSFGDSFVESDFYKYGDEELLQLSVPSRSVVLQLGFTGRHCDYKVYYKLHTQSSNKFNVESGAIGTAFTYYF